MIQRRGNGGVTLIEMLVVLVMISVLAGAAALTLVPKRSGQTSELVAIKLAADLRRAVGLALDHQQGFAVQAGSKGYSFSIVTEDGWQPHPDAMLRGLKPFSDQLRISMQDHEDEVFAVSRYLVPKNSTPWQVTLGQGASAYQVIFDGITVRTGPSGGD